MWSLLDLIIGLMFGFIFGWLWCWQKLTASSSAASEPSAATTLAAIDTGEVEQLRAEREQLQSALNTSQEQLRTLQSSSNQDQTDEQSLPDRITELEQQINAAPDEETLRQLQNRVAQLDKECVTLQKSLTSTQEQNKTVQAELADCQANTDNLNQQIATLTAAAAQQADTSPVEVDIDALKASLPKPISAPDDLKVIKGIGPKIEQTLNELGLSTYRQIALLNAGQVDQVAHVLKVFPDRMTRDDWMSQARQLHHENHGEEI